METKRAFDLLEESGALLKGHFVLTSGKHSGQYIQCALLLSRPDLARSVHRRLGNAEQGGTQ